MIWKFPKNSITPAMREYVNSSYFSLIVNYIVDSRFRTAVNLQEWIKDQISHPTPEMLTAAKDAVKTLPIGCSDDLKAIACLKYVIRNINYVPDKQTWNTDEKWQTAEETLSLKTGDCEDGAILMYVLCVLNRISDDRLLLNAGDVKGGGHCWLSYKPDEYPLNFVFLDWCYWPNELGMDDRPKFYIDNKSIIGEDLRYYTIWFCFNSQKAYTSLQNKFVKVNL